LDIHSQEKTGDSLSDLTKKTEDITKNKLNEEDRRYNEEQKDSFLAISLDIFLPVLEVSSLHFEDLVSGLLSVRVYHYTYVKYLSAHNYNCYNKRQKI
jgi:hypothetical protein